MNFLRAKIYCWALLCLIGSEALGNELAIPIYPNAKVVEQKQLAGKAHPFILSTPKRVDNTLRIEREKRVDGTRTNILLRLNDTYSSTDAYRFYVDYFAQQGEVLYQCQQLACGNSNYWANDIFGERKLLGRDSDQYYIVGKVQDASTTLWLSVYCVRNGLKQDFIYLSYVSERRSLTLADWHSGQNFEQAELTQEETQFLSEQLQNDRTLVLWVTAYSVLDPTKSVSVMLEQSSLAAEQFRKQLIKTLAIDPARVQIKALGPFGTQPNDKTQAIKFKLYLLKN